MKNILILSSFFFLFLLSSCTKKVSNYTDKIPDGDVVMSYGTSQRISETLILEIVDITDTRCPVDFICSSTGYVKVEFKANFNNNFENFFICYDKDINTCSDTIQNHIIEILDVWPYRYSYDQVINKEDFRFLISASMN